MLVSDAQFGSVLGIQIGIWEAIGVFVVVGIIFLVVHAAGRRSGRNDK